MLTSSKLIERNRSITASTLEGSEEFSNLAVSNLAVREDTDGVWTPTHLSDEYEDFKPFCVDSKDQESKARISLSVVTKN